MIDVLLKLNFIKDTKYKNKMSLLKVKNIAFKISLEKEFWKRVGGKGGVRRGVRDWWIEKGRRGEDRGEED